MLSWTHTGHSTWCRPWIGLHHSVWQTDRQRKGRGTWVRVHSIEQVSRYRLVPQGEVPQRQRKGRGTWVRVLSIEQVPRYRLAPQGEVPQRQGKRRGTWGSEWMVFSMSPGIGRYHKLPCSVVVTLVDTLLPVRLLASIWKQHHWQGNCNVTTTNLLLCATTA